MKARLVLILIISLSCSCQDNDKEKKAKSLIYVDKMNNVSRKLTCFLANKADFKELVRTMETKHYFPLELSKWPHCYKNHINDKLYNDSKIFVELPVNTQWKGAEHTIRAPEQILFFKNALVTEIVMRGDGDMKIVQYLFSNNDEAEKAIAKMKLISAFTISTSGLKNPNYYFIKDCVIYFVRVRAVSFPIGTFRKVFEEKHGKVKVLRW